MPCSPKGAIGVPSGLALLFGFIIVIMGIVIMTSTIPESKCGTNGMITVNASDKDAIDSSLPVITWPLILGGLLGAVGGGLGMFGGFTSNKCGVCAAATLLSISAAFVVIGSLAAGFFAAIFSTLCDDYKCGAESTCGAGSGLFGLGQMCKQPGVCCKTDCVSTICKETNDWACDLVSKKAGGVIVGWLGFIFITIAGGCSCGGACCCVNSFDGLGAPAAQGSAPAVVGQVVGQAA